MAKTKVTQHGDKSVYVDNNTGQITIHSPSGVQIINPGIGKDLDILKKEFGESFTEILNLLRNFQVQHKIPHALTPPPFLPEIFLGREDLLQDIHGKLFSGENLLLLVNGDGGIGKTSLAAKYYYQYADDYAHVAFVFSERGIADALLALAVPLGLGFDPAMDSAYRLERLLTELANLRKPCLLVIDNANDTTDLEANYQRLRRCHNFHLLLTTRITEFEKAATLRIGGLPDGEALDLFRKNYPLLGPDEEPLFFQIREAVGNNTLVLELLAKNLTNFNNPLRTRYALADLLADLQQKGLLQLTQTAAVRTDYQSRQGTMRHEKPEAIIAAMYDLGELAPEATALLSVFAVLPAEALDFATLETLLPDTPDLDIRLFSLAKKGWIEYSKEAATFKCSPVVQAVVKMKKADWAQDCLHLVRALAKALDKETLHEDNYRHSTYFARLGEAVIAALPLVDYDLGTLCQNIGNFHTDTGDLGKAMQAYQKMGDIQLALLAEQPDDPDFKNGLAISYEKLGDTHRLLGNLDKALAFYGDFAKLMKELYDAYPQNVSFKNGLAISYERLGDTHRSLGNLDKALTFFEDENRLFEELYDAYPQNVAFKNGLAISYEKLGGTHSSLGNLDKALTFFEQYNQLKKELYDAYPLNVAFKNGLAISYEKLGETHGSLGNLDKALTFFEQRNRLSQELYDAFPQNVSFKNGLAISYSKLGDTHSSLGNLDKALTFFEQYNQLEKELYDAYPQNVAFKNGLAISYFKLGETHRSLGNLEKALTFFEDETGLFEELYDAYPQNVAFKNGLAVSYSKLGEVHSSLGNLDKALTFFEKDIELSQELYDAYPQNVAFKNGLAISYCKLAQVALKREDELAARQYFQQAESLWVELVRDAPQYVEFQRFLGIVRKDLAGLG